MFTFCSLIMIAVNVFAALRFQWVLEWSQDKIMQFLGVEQGIAKIILVAGLVIVFLPLILRPEFYGERSARYKNGWGLWYGTYRKTSEKDDLYKRFRLFGLIPLGRGKYFGTALASVVTTPRFMNRYYEKDKSTRHISQETLLSIIAAFIPVIGPAISLVLTAIRTRK